MHMIDFNFISNNVKGLQSSIKRIKIFEYLKEKIVPNGLLFLQESHSTINDEIKWKDEFNGKLYFSHGKSNSCGVLIGFIGNKRFNVVKELKDKNGRILILDAIIDDSKFILINLYNANVESEQLNTLAELAQLLKNLEISSDKNIIFSGDFNLFFNSTLEAKGGSPTLKKHSLTKLIEINEMLDVYDIWRIRNPKIKGFTFRQKHFSGFIQRRLDYIFISQNLQESINKVKILNSFSSDHSPVFCSILNNLQSITKKSGLWKFNNSLLQNKEYIAELKIIIQERLHYLNTSTNFCDQVKWEYLKYEIRLFTINFSKTLSKNKKIETILLILRSSKYSSIKEQFLPNLENFKKLRTKPKFSRKTSAI